MLKTTRSLNEPALEKYNSGKLPSRKNNGIDKVIRFSVNSNSVEFVNKSGKSKSQKLSKFQKIFKFKKLSIKKSTQKQRYKEI